MGLSRVVKRRFQTARARLAASFRQTTVAAGYYDYPNFGDQLTPLIFRRLGLHAAHCPILRHSACLGVGSVLQMVTPAYRGAVLGSGFISAETCCALPHARPYLVRGRLTREAMGAPPDCPLGDPGLALATLFPDAVSPDRPDALGVILHYQEADLPAAQEIRRGWGRDAVWIDVKDEPLAVLRAVSRCRRVVSTSLHGLIFADSVGVPRVAAKLSERLTGGDFKFNDYASVFGEQITRVLLTGQEDPAEVRSRVSGPDPDRVGAAQGVVVEALRTFARAHGGGGADLPGG